MPFSEATCFSHSEASGLDLDHIILRGSIYAPLRAIARARFKMTRKPLVIPDLPPLWEHARAIRQLETAARGGLSDYPVTPS